MDGEAGNHGNGPLTSCHPQAHLGHAVAFGGTHTDLGLAQVCGVAFHWRAMQAFSQPLAYGCIDLTGQLQAIKLAQLTHGCCGRQLKWTPKSGQT